MLHILPSKPIRSPPRYVLASILCSFGGFLFGMDTGIIGPVTVMKSFISQFGAQSATIHGLIVSSILLPAAASSLFAGQVADVLGRPKGIAIGALIFGLGAALEAGAVSLAMFIVGRCIEGVGEGLYLGTLVVYICEISPPSKRGPLTTGPQLLITLGLVAGFFTCYGSARLGSSLTWRTPFIILACLSVTFSIASILWLVPSPRWLTLRGRQSEASAAWDVLGVGHAEREKAENQQGGQGIAMEAHNPADSSNRRDAASSMSSQGPATKPGFFDVFSRDVRTRTALVVFMMGMQQFSGIDGVLYYAPLLFQQAGLASSQASFLASGVSAIAFFVVTIPALIWADKWGRRHSTIYGGIGLAATMFLIGGLYAGNAVHGTYGAGRYVVIASIYVFAVIYAITWGIGIRIYTAEIQPQRTRASATSLAHGSNWIANFMVALTTPILLARSSFGAYFLFGGCTLLTAVVCAVYMPETKGKSLDEIEETFQSRSSRSRRFAEAPKSGVDHRLRTAIDFNENDFVDDDGPAGGACEEFFVWKVRPLYVKDLDPKSKRKQGRERAPNPGEHGAHDLGLYLYGPVTLHEKDKARTRASSLRRVPAYDTEGTRYKEELERYKETDTIYISTA